MPFKLCKSMSIPHTFMILSVALGMAYAPICLGANAARSKHALVIANNDYRFGTLVHVQENASRMRYSLTQVGFEVIPVENVSEPEFADVLESFAERLANTHGVAVIYFAGQALQIEGETYLLPLNMDIRREHDIKYSAMGLSQILDTLRDAGSTLNLVILDVATDKPLGPELKLQEQGLASPSASQLPANTVVAFPTQPDRTVPASEHYGKAWSRYILQPGLSIERVFNKVRAAVKENTEGRHSPQQFSSLEVDFTFLEHRPRVPLAKAEPVKRGYTIVESDNEDDLAKDTIEQTRSSNDVDANPSLARSDTKVIETYGNIPESVTDSDSATDQLFWESVKDSADIELISIYLDQFPQGNYSEQARQYIARLNLPQTRNSLDSDAELELWRKIKDSGQSALYLDYLKKYPEGRFAPLAKRMAKQHRMELHPHAVREMLRKARAAYANNRLLTPVNNSVLRWCETILDHDPEHREARELLKQSVGRYLSWSESQMQRGAFEKAERNLIKARSIERYASEAQLAKLRLQENQLRNRQRSSYSDIMSATHQSKSNDSAKHYERGFWQSLFCRIIYGIKCSERQADLTNH